MDHLNTQFIKLAQKETLLWFQSIIKDPSISIESIQKLNKIFERLISPNLINPVGQLKTIYSENDHMKHLIESIFDLLIRIDPNISNILTQNGLKISKFNHQNVSSQRQSKKRSHPDRWSTKESEILKKKVFEYDHLGKHKWSKISQYIKTKTAAQCAQRWTRVMRPNLKKGKWDPEEEEELFNLVKKYGMNWKQISSELKNRSDIQCRYAYKKATESRKIPWTEKDDERLVQIISNCRNSDWVEISTHFRVSKKNLRASRTALECKERWLYLSSKEE